MEKQKMYVNLALIGDADTGKSTVAGHLLSMTGHINEEEIKATEVQHSCLRFASIMDKCKAEHETSTSTNSSTPRFTTEQYNFSIIDISGHRNYMKNLIEGTTQADVVLMVVSGIPREFEHGITGDKVTIRQIVLAYNLGIRQMIVAVNKMDVVGWSERQYGEIVREMSELLKHVGFNPENIPLIPVSGLEGDNLIASSTNMSWYKGPTLIQALNNITLPNKPVDKPLRFPIQDVYKLAGEKIVLAGRVESGMIKPGTKVFIAPVGIVTEATSIEMHHEPMTQAVAGETTGMHFNGLALKDVYRGCVCGSIDDPPGAVESFEAEIVILNYPKIVKVGYTPMICCHTARVPCRIEEIKSKVNKRNAMVVEANPLTFKKDDCAIVKFVPMKPLCIETFRDYRALGSFTICDMRAVIGYGIVISIQRINIKQLPKNKIK